jgi:hypothetical protein
MLKYMKAHSNLKPGQNGTRRLVEKYGDALLCVGTDTTNCAMSLTSCRLRG